MVLLTQASAQERQLTSKVGAMALWMPEAVSNMYDYQHSVWWHQAACRGSGQGLSKALVCGVQEETTTVTTSANSSATSSSMATQGQVRRSTLEEDSTLSKSSHLRWRKAVHAVVEMCGRTW